MVEDTSINVSEIVKKYEAKINKYAIQILELDEGKKETTKDHSTKWFNLFTKIITESYNWLKYNQMFIKLVQRDKYLNTNDYSSADGTFMFPYNEALFTTVKACVEGYTLEKAGKSGFIGYLSRSLSRKIKAVQAEKKNDPDNNCKDIQLNDNGDTIIGIAKDTTIKGANDKLLEEVESLIAKDKIFEILRLIDLWVQKTKAGQENKKVICTHVALPALLYLSDKDFELASNKFKFINKEAVLYYRQKEIGKLPSQKEFGALTNVHESKFPGFKDKLIDFLKTTDNDDIEAFIKIYKKKDKDL